MLIRLLVVTVLCGITLAMLGCSTNTSLKSAPLGGGASGRYAIVLHGGAGVLSKTALPDEVVEYESSLREALKAGQAALLAGGSALDVAELVVRRLEDDPNFNAGKGAVYTADQTHELDASIMDGRDLSCGAVAGVKTVKNPISLARLVMTKTRHVMLASDGAERFADDMKVGRVPNSYFDTPKRLKALEEWRAEEAASSLLNPEHQSTERYSTLARSNYGTVGCVVLDIHGNLAAATSTGGMTGKRYGRIGDSPVIGAGCYANNQSCAISCTGTGEQFIRHGVARAISDRMLLKGESLGDASNHLVFKVLLPDDGGLIGVSRTGEITMPYNSEGMFRAAADSSGRFEVGIWETTTP